MRVMRGYLRVAGANHAQESSRDLCREQNMQKSTSESLEDGKARELRGGKQVVDV